MKEKYVLAFDHGTSGMKSAIVDSMGQMLDFEFKDTPSISPPMEVLNKTLKIGGKRFCRQLKNW